MKQLILLFIFLFAAPAWAAGPNEIKFVQVTDTHYTAGDDFKKQALRSVVKDINKQKGVSFVVFTGDNVDQPNQKSLEEFVKTVNKLSVPYYVVIGNHDVYRGNGMDKQRYLEIVRHNNFRFGERSPNYAFTRGKFAFIVVDGTKEIIPGPNGYFREDTLKWLDKKLYK